MNQAPLSRTPIQKLARLTQLIRQAVSHGIFVGCIFGVSGATS
jgi:hypothetical protein